MGGFIPAETLVLAGVSFHYHRRCHPVLGFLQGETPSGQHFVRELACIPYYVVLYMQSVLIVECFISKVSYYSVRYMQSGSTCTAGRGKTVRALQRVASGQVRTAPSCDGL